MKLLAAGSAAALASPAVAAGGSGKPAPDDVKPGPSPPVRVRTGPPAPPPARPAAPAARPALPEEVEKQKKSMAESLQRLREFPLPPGSAPAFVFRPLRSKRGRGSAR